MDITTFYKFPKELLSCTGYVSKVTGDGVVLSLTAKVVLMYMLDRSSFFDGNHYETQGTIGEVIGVDYKTVGKVLNEFVKHGVVIATKERKREISNYLCWYYKGVDVTVQLYTGTYTKPVDKPVVTEYDSDLSFYDQLNIQYEEKV